jgi:hypothetical protein
MWILLCKDVWSAGDTPTASFMRLAVEILGDLVNLPVWGLGAT